MAIRMIREENEPILRKKSKPVSEITTKIVELVEDMLDTMYEANGVGLAAPQVGMLKRIVVIDVGEGPVILINPEIIEISGEQTGSEGCLSVPGKMGVVTRPNYAKVKAVDITGQNIIVEGEELMARALCHEIDHLDGVLYIDKIEGELMDVETEEDAE